MYNNFSSKKTKKVISALLASALVVTSAPITANAATVKKVGVGKTVTYKAGATVKKVTVKNKKVVKATISKKNKKHVTLKGLKAGTTTVTVKTSKKTIKLNVKVGATKITKKTLKTTMTAGATQTVSVTATGGKGDTIKFASSNKAVLKVNKTSAKANTKGIAKMGVAAVAEGTAKLTVSSKNTGVKKAFTIKVVAATPAPATQAPATGPAVTTAAATNAPSVVTTPGVQATATAGTDATQAPGTDVTLAPGETAAPGSTDAASTDAPANTDAVATPSVTEVPFDPETATQGAITINTNVSGASIKVLSGSETVAAVTQDATKTSATTSVIAPGVYTVEISKKGYDTVTKQVTVNGDVTIDVELVESLKTGAIATVANAMTGYENTVLVNDNAIVNVVIKDAQGNPVPNKSVVFSLSEEKLYKPSNTDAGFEIKGNTVVTTDAEGLASFIVGPEKQGLKANDETFVGSVQFRASVVGSSNANDVTTGTIGFAAISLGSVGLNTLTADLVNGVNATKAGTAAVVDTTALSGKTSKYLSNQQVSKKDETAHAVTFSVSPKIVLPAYTQVSDDVEEFVQTIDKQSGSYGTYTDKEEIIVLDVDTSKLQYATLNFNKIQLSTYTKMTITCYEDEKCETPIADSEVIVSGEKEQKNFAYQIPLTEKKVKAIKVELDSAGQVQTNKNDGYDIKNITGVYNGAGTSNAGGEKDLTTASVKWEVVSPTYSNEKTLSRADAVNVLGITPADQTEGAANANTTNSDFTYTVPVFPYTGNAVIKEYDKNHKVVAYYLAPTENNYEYTSTSGKTYNNTNEIAALVEVKANAAGLASASATGLKAYKATQEEAETVLTGTITQKDNTVTVNSEKVGSTNVKGTISIDGVGTEQLNALNSTLYTSVQWNPLPTSTTVAASESNAFAALAGQKINVYAQLTDTNGNPVSLANQNVTFKYGSNDIETTDKTVNGATIVSNTGKTDVNGMATLVLSAAEAKSLENLSAEDDNGKYTVVLYVGDANKDAKSAVALADLYWIEANLQFTNSVVGTPKSITTNNSSEEISVYDEDMGTPVVGTPWEFAVKTVGNTPDAGILEDYLVSIDGLKIAMSGDTDNKGTYDFTTGNGVAVATSNVAQEDKIISKIDESSITGDITFTATKKNTTTGVTDTKTLTCVGVGSANLNAKLTLGIDWQKAGTKMALVTPVGTRIADNGIAEVDIRVTDSTGENVYGNESVYFKSGVATDIFCSDSGATMTITPEASGNHTGYYKVTTNSDGIATVYIKKGASATNASSIISAEMDNVDQITSTTINWVNDTTDDFHVVNAAMKDGSKNEVELTFNNEVNADSVVAGEFTVFSEDATTAKYYDVKSASVSGKKVTLTMGSDLVADRYYVAFNTKKVNGVTYKVVDDAGKGLTTNGFTDTAVTNSPYEISFYSTKNASFDISVASSSTDEVITVSNVIDPTGAYATGVNVQNTEGFILTVDGVVTAGTKSGDTITIPGSAKSQKIAVYYMGNVETKTIEPNSTMTTAANNLAADVAQAKTIGTKSNETADIDFTALTNGSYQALSYEEEDTNSILDGSSTDGKVAVTCTANEVSYFSITLEDAVNSVTEVLYFKVTVNADGSAYDCEDITSTIEAAQEALNNANIGLPTIAAYSTTAAITPASYTGYTVTAKSATNDTSNTVLNTNGEALNVSGSATASDYGTLSLTYTSDTYGALVKRVVKYTVAATDSGSGVDGVTFTAQ